MATSSGCFRTDECRPLAPAPSVVATPSIGSPTTSMSGWPVPRRTVCRIWYRCPSTGTTKRAGGHADGQPHQQEPGTTRTVRLRLGHTRDVSMIDGEVELLEIDAPP